jgi:predicted nucleic-acid-binding protein
VRVTVDTNILVRAVVQDDVTQALAAAKILKEAQTIAVTLPCLCEFVSVLRRLYKFEPREIAAAIDALLAAANVATNRAAVEAGLAVMGDGGDFADGLIAFEGRWLGADTFVSFDKAAVSILARQGIQAMAPA